MTLPSPKPSTDQLVANSRVLVTAGDSGPLRELASGVDALYLSARASVGPALLERLEDDRRWAERIRRAVPFELGDELVGMVPHAWGRYRFCLEHRLARIGLTAHYRHRVRSSFGAHVAHVKDVRRRIAARFNETEAAQDGTGLLHWLLHLPVVTEVPTSESPGRSGGP